MDDDTQHLPPFFLRYSYVMMIDDWDDNPIGSSDHIV